MGDGAREQEDGEERGGVREVIYFARVWEQHNTNVCVCVNYVFAQQCGAVLNGSRVGYGCSVRAVVFGNSRMCKAPYGWIGLEWFSGGRGGGCHYVPLVSPRVSRNVSSGTP